jgi:hypothetical protein
MALVALPLASTAPRITATHNCPQITQINPDGLKPPYSVWRGPGRPKTAGHRCVGYPLRNEFSYRMADAAACAHLRYLRFLRACGSVFICVICGQYGWAGELRVCDGSKIVSVPPWFFPLLRPAFEVITGIRPVSLGSTPYKPAGISRRTPSPVRVERAESGR